MKVGFTGTQHGMSPRQAIALMKLLQEFAPEEFHHGDCIGADAQSHDAALALAIPVVTHPPTDERKRAFCQNATQERPAEPYLPRNKNIVNETDVLIATPETNQEELRSGTWSTIRYARKTRKRVVVLPR